jgi:glutathione synthase/RimK-type ligase-like ATP-grasp enzyme
MRVAYVGCSSSLTTSSYRRTDAGEHDRELATLHSLFSQHGDSLFELDWQQFEPERHTADLLFLRTTWDYTEHQIEFLDFLNRASAIALIANDPEVIRWNISKRYLTLLIEQGLPVIYTIPIERQQRLADIFSTLSSSNIVLKPLVGSTGRGQIRYSALTSDPETIIPGGYLAQPFMESVITHGEISFVFVRGQFSHAVLKRCALGEYRVHSLYGGSESSYIPTKREIDIAKRFINALPSEALVCRVDLIRDGDSLLLMELEAIEPHLFPQFQPRFAYIIHSACAALLGR